MDSFEGFAKDSLDILSKCVHLSSQYKMECDKKINQFIVCG